MFFCITVKAYELNGKNLEYFQQLAESERCTEEYRSFLRKQILDYYAAHADGEDLDRYLYKLDYRKYMEADRKVLLEVLISRRMFRQAMSLVEEYGYEGVEISSLLKLTSRMILKSDMAEDDELLALASEVYREGKYDEVILHYLMLYRFGPIGELLSIWKNARGFEMDTYDLEERILELLIFTSDYRKEGEAVLESYVSQSGKERLIGAYLTQISYGVFVKEYTMSPFVRSRLEYAYTNHLAIESGVQAGSFPGNLQRKGSETGICGNGEKHSGRVCKGEPDIRIFPKTFSGASESISAG